MFHRNKKIIAFYTLTFFLIFPLYVFSQNPSYIVDEKLLNLIQNEVSGERAWDIVSKISRFHRIYGCEEGSDYDRCVEWLAGELRKIGLANVKIKKYICDGNKKSWLHTAPIGWRIKEAELWLLEPTKKLLTRFSDQAISLMPKSQGADVEAEVVYVGEGKSDDDYKNKDVKGKIVFASGGGGYWVHRQAVLKRGAAGVIVGPSKREDLIEYPDLIELNTLYRKNEEKPMKGFGFSFSRRQEKELLSIFEAGEKVKMRAKVDAELFDGYMPLIEAKIIGQEYPSQEIIIMGHLDHYKPGASDNSSGSAGMVEMVRNILSLIQRGDIPPLKRTIRFLWVPEIEGTMPYLIENQDIKERGIAGINLDCIGNDCALTRSTFDLTLAAYSVPGYINDVLINLIRWLELRDIFTPKGTFYEPRGTRSLFNYRITPYCSDSDHMCFNDSTFSIPTPMFVHHADVFWHTNMDTPDKIDPTQLKRNISLALAATIFLANADDDDAIKIAQEVYTQANLRMMRRTQKSIRMLAQHAADDAKRKDLAEIYENFIAYPQLQAQIEAANIKEVKELCKNEITKLSIENLAKDLFQQAEREKNKIEYCYSILLHQYNLQKKNFHPDEFYKKASSLKPKRLFKGPLPWSFFREKESEEDLDLQWYEKYKAIYGTTIGPVPPGGDYNSNLFEMVNLMDGKRTLLNIRHIISIEFDETDVELVIHLFEFLERMGMITFI